MLVKCFWFLKMEKRKMKLKKNGGFLKRKKKKNFVSFESLQFLFQSLYTIQSFVILFWFDLIEWFFLKVDWILWDWNFLKWMEKKWKKKNEKNEQVNKKVKKKLKRNWLIDCINEKWNNRFLSFITSITKKEQGRNCFVKR